MPRGPDDDLRPRARHGAAGPPAREAHCRGIEERRLQILSPDHAGRFGRRISEAGHETERLMRSITRRTVLKGLGTAMALPFLEAMMPASRAAMGATTAAKSVMGPR